MTQKTYQQPDAKETEQFWTNIWKPKKHNEKVEWINNMTRELKGHVEGRKVEIHIELLKKTLKKMSNLKTPGNDGIHGFWFKIFTSIHDRLALEMNRCLQGAQVPDWMTKRTQAKKGCCKGSRDTAELLNIDQHILNESKNRRKNLAMAWIDCKITYDMVLQSSIINCLKMYKISHEIINFIENTMKNLRVELTAGGKILSETMIQRDSFQEDAASALLFIIAMMPLNHILRKCTAGYKLSRSQEKINHLMYMDDIKLFTKNEKELESS